MQVALLPLMLKRRKASAPVTSGVAGLFSGETGAYNQAGASPSEGVQGAADLQVHTTLGLMDMGLMFYSLNAPAGSVISTAVLSLQRFSGSGSGDAKLYASADDLPWEYPLNSRAVPAMIDRSTEEVAWTIPSDAGWLDTPDLSALLQALVSDENYEQGAPFFIGIRGAEVSGGSSCVFHNYSAGSTLEEPDVGVYEDATTGAGTDWTDPTPGSLASFDMAADSVASGDSTYPWKSQPIDFSGFDLSGLPDGSVITGLEVQVYQAHETGSGSGVYFSLQLLKAGSPIGELRESSDGSSTRSLVKVNDLSPGAYLALPTSSGGAAYFGGTQDNPIDPGIRTKNTKNDRWGYDWTAAELKTANELGVRLVLAKTAQSGLVKVDQAKVKVYYSAGVDVEGPTLAYTWTIPVTVGVTGTAGMQTTSVASARLGQQVFGIAALQSSTPAAELQHTAQHTGAALLQTSTTGAVRLGQQIFGTAALQSSCTGAAQVGVYQYPTGLAALSSSLEGDLRNKITFQGGAAALQTFSEAAPGITLGSTGTGAMVSSATTSSGPAYYVLAPGAGAALMASSCTAQSTVMLPGTGEASLQSSASAVPTIILRVAGTAALQTTSVVASVVRRKVGATCTLTTSLTGTTSAVRYHSGSAVMVTAGTAEQPSLIPLTGTAGLSTTSVAALRVMKHVAGVSSLASAGAGTTEPTRHFTGSVAMSTMLVGGIALPLTVPVPVEGLCILSTQAEAAPSVLKSITATSSVSTQAVGALEVVKRFTASAALTTSAVATSSPVRSLTGSVLIRSQTEGMQPALVAVTGAATLSTFTSATPTLTRKVAGLVLVASSATASLDVKRYLAESVAMQSSGSALVTVTRLQAVSVALQTETAALESVLRSVTGAAGLQSQVDAQPLGSLKQISGSVSLATQTLGTMGSTRSFTGSASLSSLCSAILSIIRPQAATASLRAAVSASPTVTRPVSGSAAAQTDVAGGSTVALRVSAVAALEASITSAPTVIRSIAGSSLWGSQCEGSLGNTRRLTGMVSLGSQCVHTKAPLAGVSSSGEWKMPHRLTTWHLN